MDAESRLEGDRKATAEEIAADAERVRSIEAKKLGLGPDDPRLKTLSEEGAVLTSRMAGLAKAESALVEEADRGSNDDA